MTVMELYSTTGDRIETTDQTARPLGDVGAHFGNAVKVAFLGPYDRLVYVRARESPTGRLEQHYVRVRAEAGQGASAVRQFLRKECDLHLPESGQHNEWLALLSESYSKPTSAVFKKAGRHLRRTGEVAVGVPDIRQALAWAKSLHMANPQRRVTVVDNQPSQSREADVVIGHTPDEDRPVGFEEFATTVTQHYREQARQAAKGRLNQVQSDIRKLAQTDGVSDRELRNSVEAELPARRHIARDWMVTHRLKLGVGVGALCVVVVAAVALVVVGVPDLPGVSLPFELPGQPVPEVRSFAPEVVVVLSAVGLATVGAIGWLGARLVS